MQSIQEQVFDFIKENPKTTYQEIEENLGIKSGSRMYVSRLKKKGLIAGDINSGFEVLGEYKSVDTSKSNEVYQEMIEVYLEDFREADNFDERLKIGREIRLLLEKVR